MSRNSKSIFIFPQLPNEISIKIHKWRQIAETQARKNSLVKHLKNMNRYECDSGFGRIHSGTVSEIHITFGEHFFDLAHRNPEELLLHRRRVRRYFYFDIRKMDKLSIKKFKDYNFRISDDELEKLILKNEEEMFLKYCSMNLDVLFKAAE